MVFPQIEAKTEMRKLVLVEKVSIILLNSLGLNKSKSFPHKNIGSDKFIID